MSCKVLPLDISCYHLQVSFGMYFILEEDLLRYSSLTDRIGVIKSSLPSVLNIWVRRGSDIRDSTSDNADCCLLAGTLIETICAACFIVHGMLRAAIPVVSDCVEIKIVVSCSVATETSTSRRCGY